VIVGDRYKLEIYFSEISETRGNDRCVGKCRRRRAEGTGRRLFGLFGQQPHSVVMLFTGMAFWIVLGIVLYKAFR
jgi:hypothetical protein